MYMGNEESLIACLQELRQDVKRLNDRYWVLVVLLVASGALQLANLKELLGLIL